MSTWQPTHTVPETGAWLWAIPDGSAQPANLLDAGLPVQVVSVEGAWARVVCANGYSGWVDGRALRAGTSPPAPARSPWRWLAPGLAVALLAVVGGLVLLSGGEDGDEGEGEVPGREDAAGLAPTTVALHLPADWSLSDDGLVAAENAADLDSGAPEGPVVRAEVGPSDVDLDDPAVLELRTGGDDFEFTEAETQTIDGFDAVTMTVRGQGRVQVFLAVDPPGQEAVFFTIDCPATRFDELRDLLATVPGIES